MAITLDALAKGESAVIVGVSGDDAIAARLMEMGLIEGELIKMIGQAPMGDPVEYSVCGYRLSLRNSEAARVEVSKSS